MEINVMLLGEYGVGKTTLLQSYINNSFYDGASPNIGIEHFYKKLPNTNIKYWDTAGQEKYNSQALPFIKKANAFILVYDPSLSIEKVKENFNFWIENIKQNTDYQSLSNYIWIVANNKDNNISIQKDDEKNKYESFLPEINFKEKLFVINKLSDNDLTSLKVRYIIYDKQEMFNNVNQQVLNIYKSALESRTSLGEGNNSKCCCC